MQCPTCGATLAADEKRCPRCTEPASASAHAFLELDDGSHLPLHKDSITLGRGTENDHALADSSISRRHARLWRVPHGWLLFDLHSTNGTSVNGDPVTGPYLLQDGDRILLGEQGLVFRASRITPPAAPRSNRTANTLLGRAAFNLATPASGIPREPETPPSTVPIDPDAPEEFPTGGGIKH